MCCKMPDMDLLISRFNKLGRIVSRMWDLTADTADALVALPDQYALICIFPSLKFVTHLFQRIKAEGISVILNTWCCRVWLLALFVSQCSVTRSVISKMNLSPCFLVDGLVVETQVSRGSKFAD